MAIKFIQGFEDFPDAGNYTTLALLGKGLTWPSGTSGKISPTTINNRKWLGASGLTSVGVQLQLSSCISLADMKARKIYGGFRYQELITSNASLTNNLLRLGQYTTALAWVNGAVLSGDIPAGTEAYIEFCIDLVNLSFTTWIDGVQLRTVAIPNVLSTLTDLYLSFGRDANFDSTKTAAFNDFYLVMDTSDLDSGATPSTRLGSVRVGALTTNDATIPGDWTNPNGGVIPDMLNASQLDPTHETTPALRTATTGSKAQLGFARPNNVYPLKAISLDVFAFRDTGTATQLVAQLKQGATANPETTFALNAAVLKRGKDVDSFGIMEKDLNGAAWTADTLDQLTLDIYSKL